MSTELTIRPIVVLIEDHAELRHTVSSLLEPAGYQVRCASDTDEVIELLQSAPRPCLLLWDPLTLRMSRRLLQESALQGVHLATLPISVSTCGDADVAAGSVPAVKERLTTVDAVVTSVRDNCP